jgi:mannose-6-phosphate isomerase-like protein (cupin superfamily)
MYGKKIDIQSIARSLTRSWAPITLGSIEDYEVKLTRYEGVYGWHEHSNHDEFVYVISGHIAVEFEDRRVELFPGEGIFIRKGTVHRSRGIEPSVVMLVERENIMQQVRMIEGRDD